MKLCSCGRLATHFVVTFTIKGEPEGKKLMWRFIPKMSPKIFWRPKVRFICWLIGHKYFSDGTWGGYGGTCRRCKHNTYFIHDM